MKLAPFFLLVVIFVLIFVVGSRQESQETKQNIQPASAPAGRPAAEKPASQPAQLPATPAPQDETPYKISEDYLIKDVAFTSQAPDENWDEIHKEACEEAALFTVRYYFQGQRGTTIDPAVAEQGILELVNWQKNHWGDFIHTTAQKTGELAKQVYGYDFEVKKISSAEDIKQEISQNHLVIVPTAGRELKNPFFKTPGPIYHMLVIIGYNEKSFIVNDVGTKRGAGYRYSQQVLFNAIHDWNQTEDQILQGPKVMLILKP